MADADDAGNEELSEDEKLAAEWAAMAGEEEEEEEDGDQDGLAAEWAAMAESEEGGSEAGDAGWSDMDGEFGTDDELVGPTTVQPTRILNQDEIDSLLGFSEDEEGAGRWC